MKLRRSLQAAVVSAALVSPLAGFAQIATGSVTTDPVAQAAPALAMPLLVALAIALIGVGINRIRTRSAGAVAGFALVVGLGVLAGLSYAFPGVVIENADCNMQTTHPYDGGGVTLTSLCPNPIRIVAIDTCTILGEVAGDPLPLCTVGLILTNGEGCTLPPSCE